MVTKIPLEFFGSQIKAKKIKYNDPGSSKTPLKISCKDFFLGFPIPIQLYKIFFSKNPVCISLDEGERGLVGWLKFQNIPLC